MKSLQWYRSFAERPEIRRRCDEIDRRAVILDVDRLSKTFDSAKGQVRALEAIDFKVHRREFVCVIGPSGCGKSTLIRILAGLEPKTSGKVLLDGKPVAKPGSDRGMVFQSYSLFPWLTVRGNVMFGPRMKGMSRVEAATEADQWLEIVGLSRFANAYPHQLSGGMRQRVAIARALVNQPRILLMDEPFAALDAQTRARMQHHLLEVWKNIDITILFITHDLDEAIYLADRILVLKAHPGRVNMLVNVPLPRPRTATQFSEEGFMATKRLVEELIYPQKEEVLLHRQAEKENEKVIRMVAVDDTVE